MRILLDTHTVYWYTTGDFFRIPSFSKQMLA